MTTNRTEIYAGGSWLEAHASARVTMTNPATEEIIGTAPDADSTDVHAVVSAARTGFRESGWRDLTPLQRAEHLAPFADHLRSRAEEIGSFITTENGTPAALSTAVNVFGGTSMLDYYRQLAGSLEMEDDRTSTIVRKEARGVAAMIVPWNGPMILALQKLGPALVAGCSVVIKPSPETSLDASFLADAAEAAGLPDGVLNIVTGGRDTGAALVAHRDVDHVSFTGSTAGGKAVGAACGAALKSHTLELGGKSAAIVLPDADLDLFLGSFGQLCLANSGQGCFLSTRVLIHRSLYQDLSERIASAMESARVGDPLDVDTMYGPLINVDAYRRVLDHIESAQSEGAKLLTGGGRPSHLNRGYFVAPTVFGNVDPSMRIFREEIFGPVLSLTPFDDDDDAVRLANESDFGLGGMVFTRDLDRGNAMARRVETGSIGINGYTLDVTAPFGGYKDSGVGRELGPEGIEPFLQYKSIYQPGGAFF